MLLCSHAARESRKGAGVGLSTKEGTQTFVFNSYLSFVIPVIAVCFWDFMQCLSLKEKTVRETEIQTIQKKVRILIPSEVERIL